MDSNVGTVKVFDLHSDIATDIAMRRARGEREVFKRLHYPRLVNSGVKALVSVLWVEPEYRQQSAFRVLQLLGSLMADFKECDDCVQLVTDAQSISRAIESGKIAVFLGVEGMTFVEKWPILESAPVSANRSVNQASHDQTLSEQLRQSLAVLTQFGLRDAILVWGENNLIASGPLGTYRPELSQGLTTFGRHVVRELVSNRVVVDLSHLDDESIDGVLEVCDGVLIASHSNARALCDVPRNLINRHIREIGHRRGVIGLNAYPGFIDTQMPSMDRFIDHLAYIAGMIGIDHIAFGFDFMDYLEYLLVDGVGSVPTDFPLRGVEGVPKLIQRLHERGFTDDEIEKVAFTNAMRVMTLP